MHTKPALITAPSPSCSPPSSFLHIHSLACHSLPCSSFSPSAPSLPCPHCWQRDPCPGAHEEPQSRSCPGDHTPSPCLDPASQTCPPPSAIRGPETSRVPVGARRLADSSELSFWLSEPRFLFRRLGLGLPHWGGAGGGVGMFPGGPPPVGAPTGPGSTRGCGELRFLTALQTSEQTSCVCLGGADDNGLKLQQKGSRLVFTKAFLRIANRWSRLPGAVPDSPALAVLREPRGDGWLLGIGLASRDDAFPWPCWVQGGRELPRGPSTSRAEPRLWAGARGTAVHHMCWAGPASCGDLEVLKIIPKK